MKEAAVLGVPDAVWGEVGAAFVVLEDSAVASADLTAHCRTHFARYKVPKHFHFVASLPKGDTGKVLRRQLAGMRVEQ